MKHSPELKHLLLLQLRDGGKEDQINSYPPELVLQQQARLIDEGLATGKPIKDGLHLRWVKGLKIATPGHQLLERLENGFHVDSPKAPQTSVSDVLNRRYQVFVSSTFEDLKEERQFVMTALLKTFCIPTGMELFPASNAEQWSVIERVIDDCDYYVVIVGGKYGTIDTQTGLSFTEREFDYAVKTKKPILAFYHRNLSALRSDKVEDTDIRRASLQRFATKVKIQRMCEGWETAADLGSAVKSAIINQLKDNPQPGWIRADAPTIKSEVTKKGRNEIDDLVEQGKQFFHLNVQVFSDADAPFPCERDYGRQLLFNHRLAMPFNNLLLALAEELGNETTSKFVEFNRSDSLVHDEMESVVAKEAPKYFDWFRCVLNVDDISQLFHIWNEQGIIRITRIEPACGVVARLDRRGLKVVSKLNVLARSKS